MLQRCARFILTASSPALTPPVTAHLQIVDSQQYCLRGLLTVCSYFRRNSQGILSVRFHVIRADHLPLDQVEVEFFLNHWHEIRSSESMNTVWQQIRSGRHPGFEEGLRSVPMDIARADLESYP